MKLNDVSIDEEQIHMTMSHGEIEDQEVLSTQNIGNAYTCNIRKKDLDGFIYGMNVLSFYHETLVKLGIRSKDSLSWSIYSGKHPNFKYYATYQR